MEHKYTPGEWKIGSIQPIEDGGYEAWIDAPNHGCFAKVVVAMQEEESNDRLMANARLIAAAPDLLEALIDLMDTVEGVPCGPEDKCRAAIAKATGATHE